MSLHKKQIKDYEAALNHINKAIDTTPSVIEFFTLKSTILKRVFQFRESEIAYSKAKKLDVGDRFLNAKHAKAAIRAGNYKDGEKVMHEFVKGTIDDESLDHTQTTWYILEVAFSNLRNGEYASADRLLNSLLSVFHSIFEDQFDFFNYCLRRNMVNHLVESMEYMDRVFDHSHLYKGLEAIDVLYEFCNNILKDNDECQRIEKLQLAYNDTDFKDTKYKFVSFKNIKEKFEKELLVVIQRLQAYSKDEHFHYFAVKFSLINKKPLLAYKSLNYLKLNCSKSQYYTLAKDLIAKYVVSCQSSVPYNNILVELFPEMSNPNQVINDNKKIFDDEFSTLKKISCDLKDKVFKKNISLLLPITLYLNDKSDIRRVLEGVLEKDLSVVSQVSYKNYSKLITLARLFLGEEYMKDWNTKFIEKFSVYSHPSKTIYNLDLYDIYNEDKKPKFNDK
jgi:tetratricopeptide (TPR) repeat protein